jgi:hypothetical protein
MRLYATVFLTTLALPCFGQVLVEHSAAAAGGTMGALAGKSVSQGLGAALTALDKAAAKTAKAKPAEPKTKEVTGGESSSVKPVSTTGTSAASFPAYGQATAGDGMPASSGGVTRQNRPVAQYQPAAEPLAPPVPPPPPVHYTSREEVTAIQAGTSRGDVIAKLGPPASMVTIPDEGHLVETFKYISGNNWIGTVRLDNGSVVKVDSPQQ